MPRAWDKQRKFLQMARQIWWDGFILMAKMKLVAEQNRRLKRIYVEMSMQNDLLKQSFWKRALRLSQRPKMAIGAVA